MNQPHTTLAYVPAPLTPGAFRPAWLALGAALVLAAVLTTFFQQRVLNVLLGPGKLLQWATQIAPLTYQLLLAGAIWALAFSLAPAARLWKIAACTALVFLAVVGDLLLLAWIGAFQRWHVSTTGAPEYMLALRAWLSIEQLVLCCVAAVFLIVVARRAGTPALGWIAAAGMICPILYFFLALAATMPFARSTPSASVAFASVTSLGYLVALVSEVITWSGVLLAAAIAAASPTLQRL